MSEILAWDGPWSTDLVNLMLPVAVEIETKRDRSFYNGALAAVSSLFKSEIGRDYADSLDKVLRLVKEEQLEARGVTREERMELAADELARKLMGMKGLKRR